VISSVTWLHSGCTVYRNFKVSFTTKKHGTDMCSRNKMRFNFRISPALLLFIMMAFNLVLICTPAERLSPYTTDQEVESAVVRFRSSWKKAGSDSTQQECSRTQSKIIAMSLYGREDGSVGQNFLDGAIENGRLVPQLYPGWTLRVYTSLPYNLTQKLRQAGIEVFL
jgi:hypothetical protein